MWVFPLLAASVSGFFAGQLFLAWSGRRRPHLLAWAVALAMFALASVSAAYGMLAGWSEPVFKLYYLLGAISNVVVLGLGSVYLLAPRKVARACAAVVLVAVAAAAVAVFSAELMPKGLETTGIPRGSEVMPAGVRVLSRYYSITGFLAVVVGALYSAGRLARERQPHVKRLAVRIF